MLKQLWKYLTLLNPLLGADRARDRENQEFWERWAAEQREIMTRTVQARKATEQQARVARFLHPPLPEVQHLEDDDNVFLHPRYLPAVEVDPEPAPLEYRPTP